MGAYDTHPFNWTSGSEWSGTDSGSVSDPKSEGCVFKSCQGQNFGHKSTKTVQNTLCVTNSIPVVTFNK